jgi:GT2 family glycosyltransferase
MTNNNNYNGNLKLSIIIITYNNEKEILNCLHSLSLALLKYSSLYEIIIIDNKSIDRTAQIINNFLEHFRWLDIRFIANKQNIGFAKANNQAIKIATGEIYWLLNPDTVVPADFNINELTNIVASKEIGILGISLLNLDGSKQNSYFRFITPLIYFFNLTLLGKLIACPLKKLNLFNHWQFSNYEFKGKSGSAKCHPVDYVSGASMFIKKAVTDDIGLLNEDSFMFCDDNDLCFRARNNGWDVITTDALKIYHIGGASYVINLDIIGDSYYKALLNFAKKHFSRKILIVMKILIIQDILMRSFISYLLYNDQNNKQYTNAAYIKIVANF